MTMRIVDRRFDSKNKSSVNRSRFIRRFKGQIRKAVSDAVNRRGIRDLDNGEKIGIPGKDIAEPQFTYGSAGVHEIVSPGNDRFANGDQIARPQGGAAGAGKGPASPEGQGEDDFSFTLSKDEFLDIFFDELALPNLVKRQLARTEQYRRVRAGFTPSGVPTNINLARTMRNAVGRRIATGTPYHRQLRELEGELLELRKRDVGEGDPQIEHLEAEIARLRKKIEALPRLDPFDLHFNHRVRVPQATTQAVMFCLLDVSGSMDEGRKNIAKRFFMLLYLFLTRNYEHIEVVFIRHHTVASEVAEDNFFTSRETGGTVVSSALELMRKIVEERFPSGLWNIYGAQASDGDNWNDDSARCRDLLENALLPLCQFYAYIEITQGEAQNLWLEYNKLQNVFPRNFSMQRIANVTDIYPVFRELFKRRS